MKNKEKKKYIILGTIRYYSRRGGISEYNLFQNLYSSLSAGDIYQGIEEVKEDKLIDIVETNELAHKLKINKKGEKEFKKHLKEYWYNEKSLLSFLRLHNPEISLSYRIYNIEAFVTWGILAWLIFRISIDWFSANNGLGGVIALVVSIVLIGIAVGYLSKIITSFFDILFYPLEEKLRKEEKFGRGISSRIDLKQLLLIVLKLVIFTLILMVIGFELLKSTAISIGITILLGIGGNLSKLIKKND